jgi:cytochrome bd ubiquinol oxidase subunit I
MNSALAIHRLHFAFTITFHYIFPQLTMGLVLLIVILKSLAWKRSSQPTVQRNAEHGLSFGFWWFVHGIGRATGYSVLVYQYFTGKVEYSASPDGA